MSSSNAPKDYAEQVRGHYEELPYPYRDPAQEAKQFHGNDAFSLEAFAHFGWAGRRNLYADDTRVLIAGNGTGDGAIQFAETLLGTNAKVVAIDLSRASIELSKARLAKRGLSDRVEHHHLSILDLPGSGLGPFDIIECSGVLHHLPDPDTGLRALASVLSDDGIMGIMVYATYGRVPIYMIQDLLKRIIPPGSSRAQKIEMAREFLNYVPNSHWITVKNELFLEDINWPDGSGIYDLFLHDIDRSYTVPQIYDWVNGAGLNLVSLFGEQTDDTLYRPQSYTGSALLREQFATKELPEQHAIAELMNGTIAKHHFYAAKTPKAPAQLEDDMVISYGQMQSLFMYLIAQMNQVLAQQPVGMRYGVPVKPSSTALPLNVTNNTHTAALAALIDGKTSVGAMLDAVVAASGAPRDAVREDLKQLYEDLRSRNVVYLREETIAPYISASHIIERFMRLLQMNEAR